MRFFIDMDGTLAKWNNVEFEQLFEKGYYRNLEPNRDILDEVKTLITRNEDIYILSCVLPESQYAFNEKKEWLKEYLPELSEEKYIFVPYGQNKADYLKEHYSPITSSDYLIDDYTKNLQEWKEYGGTGVKYLNGINHTKGTWQGKIIYSQKLKQLIPDNDLHYANLISLVNSEYAKQNTFSVYKKEKSTLLVDEDDILKMSERIQNNIREDKEFSQKIDDYINHTINPRQPIIVGSTPNILSLCGANKENSVVIMQKTIKKCMSSEIRLPDGRRAKNSGHELPADIIKQLPEHLRNPAIVLSGSKANTLVIITDIKDRHNREIMVAVALEKQVDQHVVNEITSMYGRDNMIGFIKRNLEDKKILAYNIEKANKIIRPIGGDFPEGEPFISFDNSIAYSMQNVNFPENSLHKVKATQKSFNQSRKNIKDLADKVSKKISKKQPAKEKGHEIS